MPFMHTLYKVWETISASQATLETSYLSTDQYVSGILTLVRVLKCLFLGHFWPIMKVSVHAPEGLKISDSLSYNLILVYFYFITDIFWAYNKFFTSKIATYKTSNRARGPN